MITTLHKRYYYTLKSLAMTLTHNENEAEELVSSMFAKICFWSNKRIHKITTWDSHSTCGYLAKTLSNINTDIQRKRIRQKRLEKNYLENFGKRFEHSPETTFVARENIRIIKLAYHNTLAEHDKIIRVAFYLRTERGWKNKDIAEKFDQSANTVGTNFRRLRLKIKEKIS